MMAARLVARASPRRLVVRRNAVVASSSRAVPCSVTPEGVATINNKSVSYGATLKTARLVNSSGATTVGDAIGDNGVVVFLRHLGW